MRQKIKVLRKNENCKKTYGMQHMQCCFCNPVKLAPTSHSTVILKQFAFVFRLFPTDIYQHTRQWSYEEINITYIEYSFNINLLREEKTLIHISICL